MHHYFEAITNTSGASLIGYFARVIDRTTQGTVPIYADDNGTPIITVSGHADMAKTDEYGNLDFYIEPGSYHLDIYAPDATTFRFRVPNVGMNSTKGDTGPAGPPGPAGNVAADLPTLKAADTGNVTMLYDQATFTWTPGDFTGQADEVNIVQSDNAPLSEGAWVRQQAVALWADDGKTVQDNLSKIAYQAVAAFKASTQVPQGTGSIWRVGRHSYREAASDATDQHITNAAGVKFYVIPSVMGYDVEAFGADMTGATDSAPVVQALANLLPNGGTIAIPPGTLKLESAVTLPPRVNVIGSGALSTIINCTGDGLVTTGTADDQGLTEYADFTMIGASRTTGTALGIAMNTAAARIQGVRVSNVIFRSFNVAIQARTMWHGSINGCRSFDCSSGIRLQGQCVKVLIGDCAIVSEGSSYNDGSIGIYADAYMYSDSVTRRPEDVVIDATLVYGYDRDIYIGSSLSASVINSDIDAALRIAVECATVDYGLSVDNNWIALIHNANGTVGVRVNALSAANTAQVSISKNRISATGTYTNASTGIQINGANRTGVISIRENNIGMGAGIGTALYLNTASRATVSDNNLTGGQYSVNSENGGAHNYDRNILTGAIRRVGSRVADRFGVNNRGSAVTGYSGPVTIPANATSVTLNLVTDLGLSAAPITGAPASLIVNCQAWQCQPTVGLATGRGNVFARYDGAGNIIVDVQNLSASASSDIWLEMFCI